MTVSYTGDQVLRAISDEWPLGVTMFIRPKEMDKHLLEKVEPKHSCNGKGMSAVTIFDEVVGDFTRTSGKGTLV